LIAAQPGEFVLNRNAVSSIGMETADFINRNGKLPGGKTINNNMMVESGAINIVQSEGQDSEDLANKIIDMLLERSSAGESVLFESGIRVS
jgi:hypothetical protein